MLRAVNLYARSTKGLYPKIQSSTNLHGVQFHNQVLFSSKSLKNFVSITSKIHVQTITQRTFFSKKEKKDYSYSSDEPTWENIVTDPLSTSLRSLFGFIVFGLIFVEGMSFLPSLISDKPGLQMTLENSKSEDKDTKINAYQIISQILNMIAVTGTYKFNIDPFLERCYAGLLEQYIPQYFSLLSLQSLTTAQKDIVMKVADSISWADLANNLDKDDDLNTDLAIKLMNNLAVYEANALVLVKRDIVPFLDSLLKSEKSEYMLRLIHIAALLSRNEEAATALVDEIPQIYLVMKANEKTPQLYELGQEAIGNIMKSTKLNGEQMEKVQQHSRQIPIDELDNILRYQRVPLVESELTHELKSVAIAASFAAFWGALRWSIRRKAISAETLRVRVPITMLSAVAMWMVGHTEHMLVGHKSKSDVEKLVLHPLVTIVNSVAFWACITIAPYSIIPTIVAPLSEIGYKFFMGIDPAGDARWDENRKPEKRGLIGKWLD